MFNDFKAYIRTKPKRSLLWLVFICLFVSHAISSNDEAKRVLLRQYQIAGMAMPTQLGGVFQEQQNWGGGFLLTSWLDVGGGVTATYVLPKGTSLEEVRDHYCNLFLSMGWYELNESPANYYNCRDVLPKGKQYYFLGFCEGSNQGGYIDIVREENGLLGLTVKAAYRGSTSAFGC